MPFFLCSMWDCTYILRVIVSNGKNTNCPRVVGFLLPRFPPPRKQLQKIRYMFILLKILYFETINHIPAYISCAYGYTAISKLKFHTYHSSSLRLTSSLHFVLLSFGFCEREPALIKVNGLRSSIYYSP